MDNILDGNVVMSCPIFLDNDGNRRIDTLKLLFFKPSHFKIENIVLSSEELDTILNFSECVAEVSYCLILGKGIKPFVSSPTDKIRKVKKINKFKLMDI